MTRDAMVANNMLGYHPSGQSNQFLLDERFKPYGLVTGVEAQAGGTAHEVDMQPGDHVYIPPRERHRVDWTTPDEPTVWLAVFYS